MTNQYLNKTGLEIYDEKIKSHIQEKVDKIDTFSEKLTEHTGDTSAHIPEGGSEGQILSLGTDGIASWTDRNIYFVNISIDDEGNFASDTTYDEIAEKLINNTSVYMDISKIDIGLIYLPFFMVQSKALMFGMFLVNAISGLAILPDNSIEEFSFRLTASDVGLGNVEDKSAATILNELTKENVTHALGYTPLQQSDLDVVEDKVDDHIADTDIHFTSEERTKLAGIATGANKYTHPTSGVSAGTYKSVTVDTNGHVTAGTNPTTLAGYGITDAEVKGTASSAVSSHNSSTSAHSDIRELITGLTSRLNTLADSDDTTLDQMSEFVAYIKSNKSLIDSITTSKINVSDIINNLTTNVSDKPLSASQGVVLRGLIDALQSELDTHENNSDIHFSATERTKLSGIATGAEVNQNAFSNIVVGSTTIAADSKTDSLTLAGSNVTISADATNDKVTFSVANGTTSAKGVVQLTNSTSSTSTTTAATPNSVKSAYDLANTAKTNAATAQTAAETAQETADSKIESVALASGTNNGTLKLTVDGTATDNIAVTGLGSAAYKDVSDYVKDVSLSDVTVTVTKGDDTANTFNVVGKVGSVDTAEIFNDYSNNVASKAYSHAEGYKTTASGSGSHAEGRQTTASGSYSHAEGYGTTAKGNYQHVQGVANITDTENKYAFIIGNGDYSSPSSIVYSNAHTVDWDGNAWYSGSVTADGFEGITKDNVVSALGYEPGQKTQSTIENITIPVSSFVLQDDGTYLYSLSSDLISADSIVDAYFSADCQTIGMKAQITVTSEEGIVHFYAKKQPTGTLYIETLRIISPVQDDSYNEDYNTELAELQNPTFEDYSSTTYSEEFDTSIGKIASKGLFSKILEGIKGSLLNLNTRLTSCNNDLKNYLPLTGGTLTGQILYLNNGTSRWISNGTATQLEQIDGGNTNNRTVLLLNSNATELNDAIKMFRVTDGSISSYKLYGDHNRDAHVHSQNLRMNDGVNTQIVMRCYDDGDAANYGSVLVIGASGNTYIGSGESASNLFTEHGSNTSENMYITSDSNINLCTNCNTIANKKTLRFSASALYPDSAGMFTLGTSTYKWGQIYSTASSISTSDANQKHDIQDLDSKSIDFTLGLIPKSYKFNDGTSNRSHWGLIAQDVESLMENLGITSEEFAGFIKSPKEKIVDDITGNIELDLDADGNIQYEYALRYEEFIAPLIKTVQYQQEEINTLKTELKGLRVLINEK